MLALAHAAETEVQKTWHVGFSVNDSYTRSLGCLRNASYEVYYPQIREMRPIPKRKLTANQRNSPIKVLEGILVPFWPRYFFIRLNLLDGRWHDLFELAHIRGLLCDDQGGRPMPAPIDDSVIAGIKAMEVNDAIPAAVTVKQMVYEIGESVRINKGVFSPHSGIVYELPDVPLERLDEGSRMRLLVSLFGRSSVVELALGDIEKL